MDGDRLALELLREIKSELYMSCDTEEKEVFKKNTLKHCNI